jgi:hypothetical protein
MSKSDTAVSLRPRDHNFANDYLNFLGEYEAICEKVLARESGPMRDCFMKKKNRGSKISWHCPFNTTSVLLLSGAVWADLLWANCRDDPVRRREAAKCPASGHNIGLTLILTAMELKERFFFNQ